MSAYSYLLGGVVEGRHGSEHPWNVPWKAFATRDGYLVATSSNEEQWKEICRGISRPDLIDDPRFSTQQARGANREELYSLLDEIFIERDTSSWIDDLSAMGSASAPVNTIDKVFSDPQVLHRGMLTSVQHTTLGEIPQVGHAQKFSSTPAQITLPPPVLGEHTEEVLLELTDLTPDEVSELKEAQVVFGSTLTGDDPASAKSNEEVR
jgi:succinate--hydroxymethylglutarate CoA-transferase